jgi:hypothetical protein
LGNLFIYRHASVTGLLQGLRINPSGNFTAASFQPAPYYCGNFSASPVPRVVVM